MCSCTACLKVTTNSPPHLHAIFPARVIDVGKSSANTPVALIEASPPSPLWQSLQADLLRSATMAVHTRRWLTS